MKINPDLETAQNSDKFTLDYFCKQTGEFRNLFCSKDFWAKTQIMRDLAVKAYGFVYLNLLGDDGKELKTEDNERSITIFQSTMNEYNRRECMLLIAGKVNVSEE